MLRLLAALMALLATASASSNGQYTIMYSKTIRSGSPLEISILIPTIDEPVTLTAALKTFSWRGGETRDVYTETKMYNNLNGLNQDTWQFNPPVSALSSDDVEYNLQINGTGGVSFSNITKLTIARKTNSVFIQTDKGMYKPGQKVRFRVYQVDPDLEPLYETLTVSLKDDSDNLLWQEKDIQRSSAVNMGVVKGEYQLSDQPVLGQWKIVVETASGETTEQYFEVAEFVLPKFEVEMKFDKSYHLKSEQTIKGKVCGKYTYGKDVKGKAKVEASISYPYSNGLYYADYLTGRNGACGGLGSCGYDPYTRETICTPDVPCPSTILDVELDKGCAEIEITKWELYYLYPSINAIMKREGLTPQSPVNELEHALRQYHSQGDINDLFNHKVLNIRANITEEATGKTIPGDFKVNFIMKELKLEFSQQMEKNFKPGLPFQAIVEVKDTEDASATPEMLKDRMGQGLPLNLKVYKVLYYYWPNWSAYRDDTDKLQGLPEPDPRWTYGGYRGTKRTLLHEWNLDVPTDAVVTRTFDIPAETNFERIELEASMNDRYGEQIDMSHSVNVHKTRTNNQLSLTKTLVPGGKDQVGSTMQFNIRSTAPFNKIYYIIMGKGQVRRQDVLSFNPASTEYNLLIGLTADFAKQISPSGRVLILACVGSGDQEEMLAASLDFTVDGAMANHLNLRFAPNETKPGNEVSLMIDTEPNSFVTLLAMDQSMILLTGNENDVTEDEIMKELGEYDSAGGRPHWYWRRKRSFWCPWCYPWSRGGNDPYEVIDNAGAVVLSNCPIYRSTPDNTYYYGGGRGQVQGFWGARGPAAPAGVPMGERGRGRTGAAGPVPESAGFPAGPNPAVTPVARVRQEFPEAWIWTETSAGSDGTQELKVIAPDTITSWVLSGLSLNSAKGLGVSSSDTKLRVFKPFFVSLDLPYHMIQGEEAKMQVTVFNYKSDMQRVKVTIKSSDEYVIRKRQEDNQVIQQDEVMWLNIEGDDSETIVVWLRPVVITTAMNIEVHAQSPEAADAVRRKIVVKPRGKPEEKTDSVLVIINDQQETFTHQLRVSDLLPEGSQRETRDVDGRAKLVPGSEYIYVTAQGDLMGSTLDNLGSLIRMPYGCGEQNMVNFVPNIHVLRYLRAVNKQTPELEDKAKRYMRAGYSRELTYQHTEGGFSAFGNSDAHASTWLTAFVMKSFQEAAEFITVDPMKIELTLRYLLTQQDPQGWFMEPGSTHSSYLKGGAGTGDALTAYVLIALQTVVDHLDEGSLKTQTQNAITNAQNYLLGHLQAGNYDGEDDSSYTLAIITKALVCSSSTRDAVKNTAITKLASKAINNGGMRHWADAKQENEMSGRRRYWRNPSTDVERTAYAAMAYMCKDGLSNVGEVIPITKWLITQQGPYGGYSSTQDTVLVIGFLADFTAAYSSNSGMNMDITLKTNNNEYTFNRINSDNAVVLQKIQLDKTAEYVNVMATGTTGGIAVVQLVVKYYTEEEAPEPSITVDVITTMLNNNAFSMQACGKWEKDEDSAMGVVTLTLPSGYETDTSGLVEMNKQIGAKRIDRNDNEINIYVDKFIAGEEMCFGPLVAEQVNVVSNLQEARVFMYDYYDTGLNGYRMYLPPELRGNGLPGGNPAIGQQLPTGGNGNGGGGNGNVGNEPGSTTGGSSRLATSWILATVFSVLMGILFLQ